MAGEAARGEKLKMKMEKPFQEKPEFEHLRKVIRRETKQGPVPIIEMTIDPDIMSEATGIDFPCEQYRELAKFSSKMTPEGAMLGLKFLDLCAAFYPAAGYDYVTMYPTLPFIYTPSQLKPNPQQQGRARFWQQEHEGLLATREQFEAYPWPKPGEVLTFPIDYVAGKMKPGMKGMAFFIGIFEQLRMLTGFEALAVKSIEEPDLVEDIIRRVAVVDQAALEKIAAHPSVGAVFYADDLGFNTGLMLSPGWMREHIIPVDKRIAEIVHKQSKPFLFHTCGKVDALMEDLIEVVKIDARHSFQDNAYPVEEEYRKYHDRISILGGLDLDLLARATPERVRARTRQILEACSDGGYCMGSGNSVTNFCKPENYYAMIDETRKWNEEHS